MFDQIHAQQGQPAPQQSPGFFSPLWNEGVVNPARQVAAGFEGASASANHLTANVFDLLDNAATSIGNITGASKGGVFKSIADWGAGIKRRRSGKRSNSPAGARICPASYIAE